MRGALKRARRKWRLCAPRWRPPRRGWRRAPSCRTGAAPTRGAEGGGRRRGHRGTEATVVEQRAMVEHLTGCEIVEVSRTRATHHARPHTNPAVPGGGARAGDGTRAAARAAAGGSAVPATPSEKTHTMVSFHRGSTAVRAVCLDPLDAPIEDIVADALAAGCDAGAAFLRGERRQDARGGDWRRGVRARGGADAHGVVARLRAGQVGLYHGTGGRAVDAPGAAQRRARTAVGLAGLAPTAVAAAAQASTRGYASVAALRATEDALAKGHEGHQATWPLREIRALIRRLTFRRVS